MSGPGSKLSENATLTYGEDPRPRLQALVDSGVLGSDVKQVSAAARRILARVLDEMEAGHPITGRPFLRGEQKNSPRMSLRLDATLRERLERQWQEHPLRCESRTLSTFVADLLGRGIQMEEERQATARPLPVAETEAQAPATVEPTVEVATPAPPVVQAPSHPVVPPEVPKEFEELYLQFQKEILANAARPAPQGANRPPTPLPTPLVSGLTPEETLAQIAMVHLEILAAGLDEPAPSIGIELVEPFKSGTAAIKAVFDLAAPPKRKQRHGRKR